MIIHGIEYEFTRGSDVSTRDGMYLEASIRGSDSSRQVAEVFFSDESNRFFVSCYEQDLPLELIEIMISEAKRLLPPEGR